MLWDGNKWFVAQKIGTWRELVTCRVKAAVLGKTVATVLYVSSDLTVDSFAFVKRLRMFPRIHAGYFSTQHSTPGLYNAEDVFSVREKLNF